jgi:hypothetical protein
MTILGPGFPPIVNKFNGSTSLKNHPGVARNQRRKQAPIFVRSSRGVDVDVDGAVIASKLLFHIIFYDAILNVVNFSAVAALSPRPPDWARLGAAIPSKLF